jgi:hypothetical protein
MDEFEAYKIYRMLRLHFTEPTYDIRSAKGVKGSTRKSLEKQKFRPLLKKLSANYTEKQFIEYMVSNFATGDKFGGMFNVEAEEIYKKWLLTKKKIEYTFNNDLDYIEYRMEAENVSDCIAEGNHPLIFKLLMGSKIALESVVIFNKLYPFVDSFREDLILGDVCLLVNKYSPFVRINKEYYAKKYDGKLKKLCLKHIEAQ